MIDHELYTHQLTQMLKKAFQNRLRYVGLQGSYMRGEAKENSDIDIMVVIQDLNVADLKLYRNMIESLGDFDKSCGFICSTTDLEKWNPLEICSLLHGTKDYYGKLETLVPSFTKKDVSDFAKVSLNNLYHEICHRYIHGSAESNCAGLPFCYKSTFFILQTLQYLRTGEFIGTKRDLLEKLTGTDREVLHISMDYPENASFAELFELLFTWCQNSLKTL